MLVAACAWVLVPLLRRRGIASVDREASNLAILRDQRTELENDLANGVVSAEQYEISRAELDRRVLEEARIDERATATPVRSGAWTAAAVGAVMPIAAVVLYLALGTPVALLPGTHQVAAGDEDAQHAVSAQQIDAMIERVKEKLAREPDNLEGWVVLARTYYATGRAADATQAFERAAAIAPNDASLLADYADALGVAQGRSLDGKPGELIQRALKADPGHWKANALAGTVAFNRKQYAKAVEHWERVKIGVPAGSPIASSIDASIAEAKQLAGIPVDAKVAAASTLPASAAAAAPATPSKPGSAPVGGGKIAGTVKLEPTLAAAVSPDDAVYVFARPADGSRMPLALLRKQVKDLPLTFTLDDSMAMSASMKLSDHGQVIIGARVSRSGNAMPQSGDLEALSPAVKVGTQGLVLVIDRTIP